MLVLVQLNDKAVYEGYKRNKTKRTPLGLAYVASLAAADSEEVCIVDASLDDLSVDQIVKAVVSKSPDFVGITCTTPLFPQLVEVVKGIKNSIATLVEIGGPHVTALPLSSLKISGADRVFIGDIPNKLKLIPNRDILRTKEYTDNARGVYEPQTSLVTSFGCIGHCGFCNARAPVEYRSIDSVMEELWEIYYKYNIHNLVFYDDSFTTYKQRVIALCKKMIEERLYFNYQVQLRLDQIDEEVMDWLVKSGCTQVGPGIESGNDEILRSMGKKITSDFILKQCKMIKGFPVKMRCSYIMGWIDETEDQIWDTIDIAQRIGADENAFSIATPYPGSRMWRVAEERGLVNEYMDFSKFLYYHKIGCNLSLVSDDKLLSLHEKAYELVGNPEYACG